MILLNIFVLSANMKQLESSPTGKSLHWAQNPTSRNPTADIATLITDLKLLPVGSYD